MFIFIDAERNQDVFEVAVHEGISCLYFCENIYVGSCCLVQGFSASGDEIFWNVASDTVVALLHLEDEEDGLLLAATEDGFIRASQKEKLVFEIEEVKPNLRL